MRLPRVPFWAQILAGLALGVLLGWVARTWEVAWLGTTLTRTGDLFVQLLKLAVAPLVFFAIVISVTNLRKVSNAARLATRTLLWFMVTSLVAVAIGLTIGLLTDPGAGTGLTAADGAEPEQAGSWLDFLTGIVPTDVITPFTELNVLQIVFMAAVTGVAALKLGPRAEPLLAFGESVLALLQKALWWVIRLAPLGSLGLIGTAIKDYGWNLIGQYATFTAGIYLGCALVLFGVYPLLLATAARVSPLQFFRGAWPAIQLAFVSRSSVGTMPLTQKVVERLGVPKEYASFAVPFGATTKMDGCASVYPAIAAIFVAQIFGVDLGVGEYLLIVFVSVIGSAATAGLTGATVMLTLTLSTLGLPLAGVGLLLAIDPVLDMMRTATNVAGQALVPVLVAARERILDLDAFGRARSFSPDAPDGPDGPDDRKDAAGAVAGAPSASQPGAAPVPA
ncbi:dicarboxylate/amino acid:cation symporter [Streptomyces sp. JJ36]|uniref:dicarboxylate/amino acid:cation symporter n=1 Tax=Streptomyces sp. JJ36 TaxID=2736645 RepID=UPI001F3D4FD7|nr:dicarboxylate/amino acid:cation symporter [Streptomyces sp. JJ36]